MFSILFELLSSTFIYLGYIKNNSFPQPLNSTDELHYIELLPEREARNKLIEHNLRLVAHICKKYDIKKELNDDLISIGTIGLIKGIDSFKVDKGHKLSTYISRCIENEILMYIRSSKNYFNTLSLNDPIYNDIDGNEISLLDTISDKDFNVIDNMALQENIRLLNKYLYILNPRELEIITKRYGLYNQNEHTQIELAKQLGISRSYVSKIEKRAFIKIYREFNKKQIINN